MTPFARMCECVCSQLSAYMCAYGYSMVDVNLRDVIKSTNLGNGLRELFNIGCQWSMPVSKNTN